MIDSGGVILGRAGRRRPARRARTRCMSGWTAPAELRIQQAMRIEAVDHATARWRQATEDLARDAYVRHFYGVDPEDPALYHLTIDSTRLPLDACVETIAAAARAV